MKTKFTSTVRARETFAKKTSHVLGCKPRCSGGEHLKYNKRFSLNGPYSRSLKASPLGVSLATLNRIRGLPAAVGAMCWAERLGSRTQG